MLRSDSRSNDDSIKRDLPRNHHYIPRFLLAGWTGDDGRLVRYDMPRSGKLVQSRRYPSQTGFVRDLYRFPDEGSPREQWLEHQVFQRIDSAAALTLAKMLGPSPTELGQEERSNWIMLMRSLMHRTPENLARSKAAVGRMEDHLMKEIRDHYDEMRGPNDPPTLAEFEAQTRPDAKERTALGMLPGMMAHQRIGTFLINMHWRIFEMSSECPALLLSDDPLARSNGLAVTNGHMAMPLSPRRMLVLANSPETMANVLAMKPRQLAAEMNKWTVESARRFVAAVDRSQERFIGNRFGKSPKPSLMANLGRMDEMYVTRDTIRRGQRERLAAAKLR